MNWVAFRYALSIVSAMVGLTSLICGLFVGWLFLAVSLQACPIAQSVVIALLPVGGLACLLGIGVSAYRMKAFQR